MLPAKLIDTFGNKTVMSIVVIASLIVGGLISQMVSISLDLAEKENTIQVQSQEIEHHLQIIAIQRQEAESKEAVLKDLSQEISAKSQEADDLGAHLSLQSEELARLQAKAEILQQELALLQSKIRSDEQYVATLTKQLTATQESAKRVKISHYSLAVIDSERGIVFPIEVEIINSGTGAISVDVSNAQYRGEFQAAVRTAAAVASEYTGESISDKDVIVRVIDNLPDRQLATIDGSSAGALIAGMMVAGLTDRDIHDGVLISGTINPNGTVGRVGSIDEKTLTAQEFGAKIMLVPEAQEFKSNRIAVIGVADIDDVVRYLVVNK